MSVDVKMNWNHKSPRHTQRGRVWTRSLLQAQQNHAPIADFLPPPVRENTSAKEAQELFNAKLSAALCEHDELWKKREKAEISHIQQQTASMLEALHLEIEKLQNSNRELERKLVIDNDFVKCELDRVKDDLNSERKICVELRRQLALSTKRNAKLAQALEKTAQLYKDQILAHEKKIQQLNDELRSLDSRNTTLQNQVRISNLRAAHQFNGAKHRRSFGGAAPKSISMSPRRRDLSKDNASESSSSHANKNDFAQNSKAPTHIPPIFAKKL